MIFQTATPYIYYMVLLLASAYALWRGGRTEAWGVVIMLLASIASTVASMFSGIDWASTEMGVFAVDMLALLAFIHLTLTSDRFWPIWATGFHLIAISVHVATMVAPSVTPWAFATGAAFWAYPMIAALVLGAREQSLINSKQFIS